jgi:hypothetical protein
MASWLQVVGDIFIKLLQITVLPYISLALITGIGGLSYKEVQAHAIKGGDLPLHFDHHPCHRYADTAFLS